LAHEEAALLMGVSLQDVQFQNEWNLLINAVLAQASLTRPADGGFISSGNHGIHSEHMTYLLSEMQSLARAHPHAVW
jgi:ring-1,2-phenylacetyl-CoA epoxidase subunit PaaC